MKVIKRAGGRPTAQEAIELSNLVLDGARASFCRKGIVNSTLDEISAEIGVSKHTIYRRYPNKMALLEAVVARDMERFREKLLEAGADTSNSLDAIHLTALRYFSIGSSREYAAFYLSINAEAALSADLRDRLARWTVRALEPMLDRVHAAQEAGLLRPGDPTTICSVLVDLLEGANNRVRLGGDLDLANRRLLFDQRWEVFVTAMTEKLLDHSSPHRGK